MVRWGLPGQGWGRSQWLCQFQFPRDRLGGDCHSEGTAGIKVAGESLLVPWVRTAEQGGAWQGQSLWEARACPAFTWWPCGDCVRKTPF